MRRTFVLSMPITLLRPRRGRRRTTIPVRRCGGGTPDTSARDGPRSRTDDRTRGMGSSAVPSAMRCCDGRPPPHRRRTPLHPRSPTRRSFALGAARTPSGWSTNSSTAPVGRTSVAFGHRRDITIVARAQVKRAAGDGGGDRGENAGGLFDEIPGVVHDAPPPFRIRRGGKGDDLHV